MQVAYVKLKNKQAMNPKRETRMLSGI